MLNIEKQKVNVLKKRPLSSESEMRAAPLWSLEVGSYTRGRLSTFSSRHCPTTPTKAIFLMLHYTF